jgi:hypothetical protein
MKNSFKAPIIKLFIVYLGIVALAMTSYFTGVVYYANFAGFIGAMGIMYLFFKDRPEEWTEDSPEALEDKKWRKMWYVVLGFGIFFSLIFGSLWNHQMGGMA